MESRYDTWRSDEDYRIPRVGWKNGEVQTIRLDNHWPEWDSNCGELVVADLRDSLASSAIDTTTHVHQIRALVTDAAAVKQLLRSIDEGKSRICIVPTLSEGADNTLSINLNLHCETADVEGADEFRRFWKGIIRRSADAFVERIGCSIETEIREPL